MKIIIDPGHSSACVNGEKSGYKEHQGMWELSLHLMRILQAKGATVSLTRTYEAEVALSE